MSCLQPMPELTPPSSTTRSGKTSFYAVALERAVHNQHGQVVDGTGRQEILRYRDVTLGIAAQTPRALAAPVIDAANTLTTAELSASLCERPRHWPRTAS